MRVSSGCCNTSGHSNTFDRFPITESRTDGEQDDAIGEVGGGLRESELRLAGLQAAHQLQEHLEQGDGARVVEQRLPLQQRRQRRPHPGCGGRRETESWFQEYIKRSLGKSVLAS